MSKKSTRNRHTGKVNAFKASIIRGGKRVVMPDRVYYVMRIGRYRNATAVRTNK